MTTIPRTSIILGDRARTTYTGIDDLASSILDTGLIEPIVLKPLPDNTYLLLGGGRRTAAADHLGITEWHFAKSCCPGKVGYVLADGDFVVEKSEELMVELIENLHRVDLDWREQLKLIVPAYLQKKSEALRSGGDLFLRTFGKMIGVGYSDIQAAVKVYDEVLATPEKFDGCSSILQAYQKMLDDRAREAEAMLVREMKVVEKTHNLGDYGNISNVTQDNARVTSSASSISVVSLSPFRLGNSLDWMESERPTFDHIICDPDFAVSQERLEASVGDAALGIAQTDVESSLADLRRFITLAAASVRSYFIFFYDLDHHEKLQSWCKAAGFRVQRWPILWHKTDYRSNAAPQHNFTKNMEYAMVCRQASATLTTAAPPSVISLPSGNVTDTFGHPFAKPADLWTKIFSSVARPGQTTFDPFMGSGSSVLPALRLGLLPAGMELQPQHYNRAILNIQEHYRKLDPHVQFTQ
jgi:hypothetical protein